MLSGLVRYRTFIWQSALSELRHRYAGTGLGVVWNVLHPLALIAVYFLVFGSIMSPGGDRFQFLLYLCSGLLPYLAFTECVTRGTSAFAENAAYLKKLPIPEHVFVARTAASATLGLLISFTLLILVALLVGHRPTWHWVLLPAPFIALQALGFAIGLLCGTLNVFFRDVGQLTTIALQLIFWTVPIVYYPQILPAGLQKVIHYHPLFPPIQAIRDLFLSGQMPHAATWLAMLAWPMAAMILSGTAFSRLRSEIRDLL